MEKGKQKRIDLFSISQETNGRDFKNDFYNGLHIDMVQTKRI